MKKIALLLARRAAALFNPGFWLYGVPTGSLRRRHLVLILTSSTGPGCYRAFPVV
jgi:hypothetical protein